MQIVFGRNNSFFSRLARFITWSKWSHVAVYDEKREVVIESILEKGVVVTPIKDFLKRYDVAQFAYIHNAKNGFLFRAYSLVGLNYDYGAMASVLTRQKWDDDSEWYCSELVAFASGLFREDQISRITPQDIWMISE